MNICLHFKAIQSWESDTVRWCLPSECLELKERDTKVIYVFKEFEGPAFEHLVDLKCRFYNNFIPIYIMWYLKISG